MNILTAIQRLTKKGVDVPTEIAFDIWATLIFMFTIVVSELISIYHILIGHVESATLIESLVVFSVLITSMVLIYFRRAFGIVLAYTVYGYHIVKAVFQNTYDFAFLFWGMMIFINIMCHISIRMSRYIESNPTALMALKASKEQEAH